MRIELPSSQGSLIRSFNDSRLESERFDSPDSAVAVGAECRDRTNGRLIERSSGHYLPHSVRIANLLQITTRFQFSKRLNRQIHLPTKWNCQIGMHDMTDVQWRRSHDYACQAQACNGHACIFTGESDTWSTQQCNSPSPLALVCPC